MERIQFTLMLCMLWFDACAQNISLDEIQLDTLTLNNISPTLLWQAYGLDKNVVFEVCNYRDAMGGILSYDELEALPSITDPILSILKNNLPLRLETHPYNRSLLQGRLRSFSPEGLILKLDNEWDGQRLMIRGNPLVPQELVGSHELKWTFVGVNAQLLMGQQTLSAGQGLLLSAPAFPSPASKEFFARGLRSSTSRLGSQNGLGWSLSNKRWLVASSISQQQVTATATYESNVGLMGLAAKDSTISAFGKYYFKNWRVFAEAHHSEQVLGINFWENDVMTEWVAWRDDNGIKTGWLMSGRTMSGEWNFSWITGKFKGRLRHGPWMVQVAQHGDFFTDDRPSFRTVVRFEDGAYRLEHHWHGNTMAFLSRWEGKKKDLQWSLMWTACHYGGKPIWLGTPYVPNSISSKAIYSDYFGIWAVVRKSGKYVSMEIDLSEFEQPGLKGQCGISLGLEELAPMFPKIRIALSHYLRARKRQRHEDGNRRQ